MDHSGANTSDEVAARVGRLIRGHRVAQGVSQAELAARSELSRTILARIERGEGNPSLGTLWRISRGLRVPLGDLLDDAPEPRTRVIRSGAGEAMDDPSGMVGRLVHSGARERRTELFAIELPAGARRASAAHLNGVEEVIVMTSGSAEIGPEGATETLAPGDALWFAGDVPHRYAALGGPCRFLCLIHYPPAAP